MLDRKRWTQKLIADTLKELSKNKSLSRITVTDICQGCGINRSTFYYHFTDRDDVIQWMFRHDIEEHFVQVTAPSTARRSNWTHNRDCATAFLRPH